MPRGFSPGEVDAVRPSGRKAVGADLLTSGRINPTGHHCRRENRGQVLVENLKRVDGVRESPVCPPVRHPPEAPPGQPPRGRPRESAGGVEPGSRVRDVRGTLWRGTKTQESIDSSGPRPVACTDLRGEQSPEAAGHRQLLVLRAGARDAGNGRRATAPKGVRLHGGETLCRANPMSGAGPADRQAREGGSRQEGHNPEDGTYRGWKPRVSGPPALLSL
jgi:hypothetical protein